MTDIVLNAINSGYNLSKINDNFQKIEDKINDEILHLTGGNNVLEQDLDVNSNRVINLPVPVSNTEPVRYKEFQELKTSAIVSENVGTIDDIVALSNIDTSALVDGQQFSVGSYIPDTSTGSCLLRWRPDLPKSRHDGVLFFSLTVPIFTGTDTTDYRNGVGETDSGGNGVMELVRGEIIYDAEVLVPSHHSTLQGAVDRYHGEITSTGKIIDVVIESGHAITKGLRVSGGDYSLFRISSVDATVPLDASYPATQETDAVVYAENCRAPTLNCLVDINGKSDTEGVFGYVLREGSVGRVTPLSGCIRGDVNLQVFEGSQVYAASTIWRDAVEFNWGRNVWVSSTSRADLQLAGGGNPGTDASGAAQRCVYVSRGSLLNFHDGNASGSQNDVNMYVIRSVVNCQNANLQNAALYGLFASSASLVNAASINANGAGVRGIWANGASSVNASSATADNSGDEGISCHDAGSSINFGGGSAVNATNYGALAKFGGYIGGVGSSFGGGIADTILTDGGVLYDGSFNFGKKLQENGDDVVELYTAESGRITVTKRSDGSMTQLYHYVEVVEQTTNRLGVTMTFTEAFASRPTVTPTKIHSSAAYLPETPDYFNEFSGGGSGFGVMVRGASGTDATIYITDDGGSITAGENGYIQVEVKGRWK